MSSSFTYQLLPVFERNQERKQELLDLLDSGADLGLRSAALDPIRDGDDEDRTESEEYIREAVTAVFDRLPAGEISTIVLPNGKHWISGGVSYGDDPTDACRYFWALTQLSTVIAARISAWGRKDVLTVKELGL